MQLTRTTIRLNPQLKKIATHKAVEMNITFQDLVNRALINFMDEKNKQKSKEIIFKSKKIGQQLDNLNRENIYAD